MTPKQVNDIFNKLPSKRRKVLVGFLAGHSREKIMIDADVPSDAALTGHLKELYKNFRIDTGWNDADDRRSGARKLPLLIALFAKYMPELISDRIPDVLDGVEQEEAIALPHLESTEAIDASAKDLSSERRVDYSRLRDLLAAGKWRDADRETGTVMLKTADKVRQGWLRSYDIKNFPCTDLQIIDSLWRKHSNGRFGFSMQKRIWLNIGGTNDADLQTFHAFADSVGWRLEGFWVARVKHTIDAPEGHLPDLDFGVSPHYVEKFRAAGGFGHDGAWNARRTILSDLASKLADCNIR
jgi:hypothetical protein